MTRCCRVFFVAAALALSLPGCSQPAEEEDEQAIKAVEELGGKVGRDENVPGRPATSVEFTKVSDSGLKQLARLETSGFADPRRLAR